MTRFEIPVDPEVDGGTVLYVTGEYPRASHTFIQREVEAMRSLGVVVETCSIRGVGEDQLTGPEERAAALSTFYILAAAKRPAMLLGSHLSAFARAPRRYLSALFLAFSTASPGPRALLYQFFYFAEAAVLARHARARGACHMHNHLSDSSCSVTMLAAAIAGLPFSFTVHGPGIFYEPKRWRLDEKIARASFVACISHFCRSQAMLFSAVEHWEKLHIVQCGISPDRYGRSPSAGRGERVLFVGRLAAVKGLLVLLDAFAKLRARRPRAVLTLVGDGVERSRLEAEAERLGVADSVVFAGYRSQAEVSRFMSEADVFALPSFAEGLPVVLMEALASEVPVVATRIAGVAELVEDGESGFLVAPGDAEALSDRLDALLADPALRARMGARGRARVVHEFDSLREATWLHEIMTRRRAGEVPPPRP